MYEATRLVDPGRRGNGALAREELGNASERSVEARVTFALQVAARLRATARPLGGPGDSRLYGAGQVNAGAVR